MKTHVTSHFEKLKKKKSELKCPICSRQMQTEASLNRHIAIAHENNQPELIEICPDCGYKGSRHAIYKHRQRHHTKTLHKCTMCTKSFAIASDLANHMRIHKKNAEKDTGTKKEPVRNYMCRLCGYRGIVYAVRVHMQRKHKPGGHPCSDCSCCFATKSELNRHAKSHLTPEEVQQRVEKRRRVPTSRVWACHICPYTTPHSETDLKEHISRKHEAPKLKCEYCGKMFAVSYDLKDHINHMHLKLKRVVCDICGLEVHRKNLKAHVQRVHEKLRPYRCDICNRSFGDRRFLLRHKTHHLPKEKRATTVFCKVCNKVYVSQKSLDDHMNVHRGIKPYACDQCDAQFSKRIMWQRHMRNHVRGLIKCPVTDCNRQMESDMLLNKHMVKKHRETAQFQCSQCLQFFSLRSVVDKHRCHPPPTGVIAFADETGEGAIQMLQEADSISEPSYIIKEEQLVVPDQSVILTESGTLESLQAMEAPPPQEGGEEAKVFMCSICQAMFTSMEEIEAHIVTHMDGTEEQSNNQVVQVENIVQDGVVQVAQDSVVQEGLLVEGEDGVYTIAYSEELQEVHESAEALTDLTFIQQ
ncbi:hypothetical protein CAPTEDRAFT_149694 [Capitella teleta]|uniref:C2H2-type domain-containing protein n=1 Tax=Capitella teleta TaxID=283909 RepID=R7VI27_CAPTE|nr:hypothetical protein CAPTEDRAFT_149694 [Capitella teleta]|eukprot:ELU18508.1 hypothetical protein CAPTEDRAFT_149694 [Capitella teleta]